MNIRNPLTAALIGASLLAMPLAASAQQSVAVETVIATTYLNGGIGKTEADAMRRMASEFPLRLTFSEGAYNEFTADVPVVISDARGNPVFELPNAGPLLYVMLPDGKYQVSARTRGRTETQAVTVARNQGRDVNFHWTGTPGE
jgi:hypothetical protein